MAMRSSFSGFELAQTLNVQIVCSAKGLERYWRDEIGFSISPCYGFQIMAIKADNAETNAVPGSSFQA